jgi:hypothetical protein
MQPEARSAVISIELAASQSLGWVNAYLSQTKMGTSFKDEPQNPPSCAMLPTQVSESFTVELVD